MKFPVYLFDTDAFLYLEKISKYEGVNILQEMSLKGVQFLLTNDTVRELLQGEFKSFKSRGHVSLNLEFLTPFIVNSPVSMDRTQKEHRLIIQEGEELKYIEGLKVSTTDYGLIVLCQNNENYVLVSNDRKLLKNASIVLPKKQLLNLIDFLNSLKKEGISSETIKNYLKHLKFKQ